MQTDTCQRGGVWGKEGKGIRQRTSMRGSETHAPVWCWPEREEVQGWVEVGRGGGFGAICHSVNNKNKGEKRILAMD